MTKDNEQLAKGVLVNALGMLAKATRPVFLIVFSRILGLEGFGLYMLAYTFQEIVSKTGMLGFDQGAMRWVGRLKAQNREPEVRRSILSIIIVCAISSSFVAVLLALFAHPISQLILRNAELVGPLRNFCWGMPAVCTTSIILCAIRPTLRLQYELYVRSIIEPVLILLIGTAALKMNLGVSGLAQAHNIAATCAMIAAWFYFSRIFDRKTSVPATTDWKFFLHTSLPMGGMDLISHFKMRLDLMVIGRLMPLQNVGIYSAVVEICSILRKLKSTFDPVLMPIAQVFHEREEKERLNQNLTMALRWILVPSLALFGVMILSPEVFLYFFGKGFEGGAHPLRIFAVGQLIYVTLGLLEGVLAIVGHAYVMLVNSVVLVIVNVILLWLLVPTWKLEGAAFATSLSFLIVALWRLVQAEKLVGVWPFDRSQLKPLLAFLMAVSVAGLGVVFLLPRTFPEYVGVAVGYLALYFLANVLLKIDRSDRDLVDRVGRKIRGIFK